MSGARGAAPRPPASPRDISGKMKMTGGYGFTLAGETLVALASGALWWPEREVLVVSDLHRGKSERIARLGGAALPPYETYETLERLEADAIREDAKSWPNHHKTVYCSMCDRVMCVRTGAAGCAAPCWMSPSSSSLLSSSRPRRILANSGFL